MPPSEHIPALAAMPPKGVLVRLLNCGPPKEMLSMSHPGAPVPSSVPMRKRTFTVLPANAIPKSSDVVSQLLG